MNLIIRFGILKKSIHLQISGDVPATWVSLSSGSIVQVCSLKGSSATKAYVAHTHAMGINVITSLVSSRDIRSSDTSTHSFVREEVCLCYI